MSIAYIEYILEDDGVRYLDNPGDMTLEQMSTHAREAMTIGAIQVCFMGRESGSETVFERKT
ncbi:MAG TPA: hypothetical protein VIM52_10630 [Stellaceae bacterium]|jgi:hypothetical protein